MNQALSWLENSNLSEDSIILDGGCGAGIFAREAVKRGYQVVGMDFSRGMVEKAACICNTKSGRSAYFLQGDMQCLPFKDSSFDLIVCLGVISYFWSEEKVLGELSRILKPCGILIVSIINRARLIHYLDLPRFMKNRLRKALRPIDAFRIKESGMKSGYAPRSYFISHFRKSLEKQGLRILQYTTVPYERMTLFDRDILPRRLNMKIAMFLEKPSNLPLIGSLGGMCIFRTRKNGPNQGCAVKVLLSKAISSTALGQR
jgi:ubiquinone/menaquinone biosynthesis C-methylase UbiE